LAALSGRATATPKARSGVVESIRALRVVPRSAVKARTHRNVRSTSGSRRGQRLRWPLSWDLPQQRQRV